MAGEIQKTQSQKEKVVKRLKENGCCMTKQRKIGAINRKNMYRIDMQDVSYDAV